MTAIALWCALTLPPATVAALDYARGLACWQGQEPACTAERVAYGKGPACVRARKCWGKR